MATPKPAATPAVAEANPAVHPKPVTAAISPPPPLPSAAATTLAAKVEQWHARGKTAATSPVKLPEPAPVKPKKPGARAPLKIPPILLEGDNPPPTAAGGVGRRYALGPTPPPVSIPLEAPTLPESYGTQKIYLTARDPRWLYAHWDFTAAQLKSYNALSADGHQMLRLHQDTAAAAPVAQIQLHPESRHWFVPAPQAGAKYAVTLGYYDSAKNWVETARSGVTLTPSDSLAEEAVVQFASIPVEVPFEELVATVQTAVRQSEPLAAAVQELRMESFPNLPEPEEIPGPWTPAQEKALAAIVKLDDSRRIWVGPVEVTEVIRRQLEQTASSIAAAQFGQPGAAGPGGPGGPGDVPRGEAGAASPTAGFGAITSPSGERKKGRSFWFNVNAELIVYGSTEPDANVEIGGRKIRLRKDGSFSFRFALPDGSYGLPITAESADGEETRRAELSFSRASQYHGGVEAHPQDATLKAPTVEAVS
jgi:hypothetical protein